MDKDLHPGPYEIIEICPITGTIRFICEMIWPRQYISIDFAGWGNGYVALPVGNPFFGSDYSDLSRFLSGELPEELTYSALGFDAMPECVHGLWVVGFDTSHFYNKRSLHTKDWVIEATKTLKYLLTKQTW